MPPTLLHLPGKQIAHVRPSVPPRGLLHGPGHDPPLGLGIKVVARPVLGPDRAPQPLALLTPAHALVLVLLDGDDLVYIGPAAGALTVAGQSGQRSARVIAEDMIIFLQTSVYVETGRQSLLDNILDDGAYPLRQQEAEVTAARARSAVPRLQNGQYIACRNHLAIRRLKSHQLHPSV